MKKPNFDISNKKRLVHFFNSLVVVVLLLGMTWGFLYVFFGRYTEDDKAAYKMLTKDDETGKLLELKVSKQNRIGLQKNLFFYHHQQRQELKIISESAELALERTGRHIELVENLHGLRGWLQESIYFVPTNGIPSLNSSGLDEEQIVFAMTAGEALYHYKGELLEANNVEIARFIVKGHSLEEIESKAFPGNQIMEGRASKMEFSLTGKHLEFLAYDFTANFLWQNEKVAVEANHASYNCNEVALNGKARISFKNGFLEADKITVQMTKEEGEGEANKIPHTLFAEGNVRISQGNFTAYSDTAFFHPNKKKSEEISKNQLSGIVTLKCQNPDSRPCRTVTLQGDEILSSGIALNTISKEITFEDPKGFIHLKPNLNEETKRLDFSANRLLWNDVKGSLILSGNVEILQQGVGRLQAENEVSLILNHVNGRQVLQLMETNGKAEFTYVDPDTKLNHLLRSYGSFRMDHQAMEIKLQSPKNSHLKKDQQVFFKDSKGEIYSDKVYAKYAFNGKKIIPSRIVLQGNVKMINGLEKNEKGTSEAKQYLLAERVDFIPQTEQMIIQASAGERVLLLDKENHMEVSAPKLKLLRKKTAGKEMIQSFGDVRFNFMESELDQLRRHFSLEKMLPGQNSGKQGS